MGNGQDNENKDLKHDDTRLNFIESLAEDRDKQNAEEAGIEMDEDGETYKSSPAQEEVAGRDYEKENQGDDDLETKTDDDQGDAGADPAKTIQADAEAGKTTPGEMVEIIVDGVKKQVSKTLIDEMDALSGGRGREYLQKTMSADNTLKEANRAKAEAEDLLAKAKAGNLPGQPDALSKADAKALEDDPELDRLMTDYVRETQYGDEETAKKALATYSAALITKAQGLSSGGAQPQGVDQESLRLAIKRNNIQEILDAKPEEGGYSDIMSNPTLKAAAGELANKIVETSEGTLDYFNMETYKRACDSIRASGHLLDPSYKAPVVKKVTTTLADRQRRKEKIITVPEAKTRSDIEDPDDKEQTPSEVIAEIKAQRGQMV